MAKLKNISKHLTEMRSKGAVTASVIITFSSREELNTIDIEGFEPEGELKMYPAVHGVLNLSQLEHLSSLGVKVEPNVQISILTDPSAPQ